MRIIAGTLKGRSLKAPLPEASAVRPTSDRAREALFSILQQYAGGPFLDLFSGTGAVAIEACSRGYHPVLALERDREALASLRHNARGTDLRVLALDVRKGIKSCGQGFMVVFADPPYADTVNQFTQLAEDVTGCMHPAGILVWETDRRTDLPASPFLEPVDDRTYGTTRFRFFRARRE